MDANKFQYVYDLMNEAMNSTHSVTGYKRVLTMCKRLDLSQEQTTLTLRLFEYVDNEGNPYSWLSKKLEGKQ
jgi:hypothetical protein